MKPRNFDGDRRNIPAILVGAGIVIILAYALFAALPFLLGPSLEISATTAESGLTTVSGTTARVSYLAVNNAEVPMNEDGTFAAERAYPGGYTWITAEARDRFGRTITKTLTFLVPEESHAKIEE